MFCPLPPAQQNRIKNRAQHVPDHKYASNALILRRHDTSPHNRHQRPALSSNTVMHVPIALTLCQPISAHRNRHPIRLPPTQSPPNIRSTKDVRTECPEVAHRCRQRNRQSLPCFRRYHCRCLTACPVSGCDVHQEWQRRNQGGDTVRDKRMR